MKNSLVLPLDFLFSVVHLPLRNLSPLFVLMASRPIDRLFLTLCMVAVAQIHC